MASDSRKQPYRAPLCWNVGNYVDSSVERVTVTRNERPSNLLARLSAAPCCSQRAKPKVTLTWGGYVVLAPNFMPYLALRDMKVLHNAEDFTYERK